MTEHLKPDLASDVHPGLIKLFTLLREDPDHFDGFTCSEEAYREARKLPDDSPLKALIGFGCSFGGKWFGGYARGANNGGDYAGLAVRSLKRKLAAANATAFMTASFFDVEPQPGFLIYADPPYNATTGYHGTARFDSAQFYAACTRWVDAGSVVFISEYACPIGNLVWAHEGRGTLAAGRQGGKARIEKLYLCAQPQ